MHCCIIIYIALPAYFLNSGSRIYAACLMFDRGKADENFDLHLSRSGLFLWLAPRTGRTLHNSVQDALVRVFSVTIVYVSSSLHRHPNLIQRRTHIMESLITFPNGLSPLSQKSKFDDHKWSSHGHL
jgi:hypothetical protein